MERSSLRLPAFLGVLVSVILILAACAPAVTPGAAPREITMPAATEEELAVGDDILREEARAMEEVAAAYEAERAVRELDALMEAFELEARAAEELSSGLGVEELVSGAEEALGVEEFALGEDSFTLELEARAAGVEEFALGEDAFTLELEARVAAEELAKGLDLATMVSEEIAIPSLEDELFGVFEAIPAEERGEYHWIPEVADVTVAEPVDILDELFGVLSDSELVAEESGEFHWPAEFTGVIPSLEEDISILDLEGIVSSEEIAIPSLEDELFGVFEAIPAEERGEYHWIPEVADVTVAEPVDILDELFGALSDSELVAEERGEFHWPAEFTQVIPSLEEDLSILDLEDMVIEEVAPSFGLEEETVPDTGYYYDY